MTEDPWLSGEVMDGEEDEREEEIPEAAPNDLGLYCIFGEIGPCRKVVVPYTRGRRLSLDSPKPTTSSGGYTYYHRKSLD